MPQINLNTESFSIYGYEEALLVISSQDKASSPPQSKKDIVHYGYDMGTYVKPVNLEAALREIQLKVNEINFAVIDLAIDGFDMREDECNNSYIILAIIQEAIKNCKNIGNNVIKIVTKSHFDKKAYERLPKKLSNALGAAKKMVSSSKKEAMPGEGAPEEKKDAPVVKSSLQKRIEQIAKTRFGDTVLNHSIRSMAGIVVSVIASLGALYYYANLQAVLSAAVVSSFAWPLVAIVLVGSVVALGLGWGLSELVSYDFNKLPPTYPLWSGSDSLKEHARYFFRYLGNVARVALMNAGAVAATIALPTALLMLLVTFLGASPLVAFVPALLVLGAIAPKLIGETLQLASGVIRFVAARLATLFVGAQRWVLTKVGGQYDASGKFFMSKPSPSSSGSTTPLINTASKGQKFGVVVSAIFYTVVSIIPAVLWAISSVIDKVGVLLTSSKEIRADRPIFAEESRLFARQAMNAHRDLSIYKSVPVVDSMSMDSIKSSTLLRTLEDVGTVLSSESPSTSLPI